MVFFYLIRNRRVCFHLFLLFAVLNLIPLFAQSADLEGYVYSGATGTTPPTAVPLAGVQVTLYVSNDPNTIGTTFIDLTTTDANGYYSLVAEGAYDYFNIVETTPAGYHSNGASTASGTVKSADWIQVNYGDFGGNVAANNFWDSPNNTPPVAVIGGPYTGNAGEAIQLDGSGSYDPDAGDSIVSYEWDLDDDGQFDDATGVNPTHVWNTPGAYTIHLRVTDTFGEIGTDTGNVQVLEVLYDFGDAPDANYKTLLASNGARHKIDWGVYLGATLDAEADGLPDPVAMGDDTDASDDEDGVVFNTALTAGSSAQVTVTASVGGLLFAWIDFDGNNSFDAGDQIFNGKSLSTGSNVLTFNVPSGAKAGASFARFRFTLKTTTGPDGEAESGEVEDYEVSIEAQQGTTIGDRVWEDLDKDGIQDQGEPGMPGVTVKVHDSQNILATTQTDVNGNYYFQGFTPGVSYFVEFILPGGYTFSPQNSGADPTVDSDANPTTGRTANFTLAAGETNLDIDAGLWEGVEGDLDFGDAPSPYPTLLADDGARHRINKTIFLGKLIDGEFDGQPTATAQGDDADGSDDDDGIIFKTVLVPGQQATIDVDYTQGSILGLLTAWIDFNADGDWDDSGEKIINGTGLNAGQINTLQFTVPANATLGITFARFRLCAIDPCPFPIYLSGSGEVEDYQVEIEQYTRQVLGDRVWKDVNKNGLQDAGEQGLASVQVIVHDVNTQWSDNVQSDANGKYKFDSLPPGNYYVEFVPPAGYAFSPQHQGNDPNIDSDADANGRTPTFTLVSGQQKLDVDAGLFPINENYWDYGDAPNPYPSASHLLGGPWLGESQGQPDADPGMQRHANALGDDNDGNDDEDGLSQFSTFVKGKMSGVSFKVNLGQLNAFSIGAWLDLNHDGDWDDADEDLFKIPGWIAIGGGGSPLGTLILGNNWVMSNNAVVGKTILRLRVQEGYDPKFGPAGPGRSGEVEDYEVEILGEAPPDRNSILGIKWNDLNGNGAVDAGEPNIPGWTIWIDSNQNGQFDAGEPTAVTDAQGFFAFYGLAAGTYHVYEQQLPGWQQTYPLSSQHHIVTFQAGQSIIATIEFGNKEGEGGSVLKWKQPPLRLYDEESLWERSFTGWGEPAQLPEVLIADDWYCRDPRPVTSITWWGAYEDWRRPGTPDIQPIGFEFGIWSDVPAGEDEDYSHPDELLWTWATDLGNTNEQPAGSSFWPEYHDEPESTFVYHVNMPKENWFYQPGDSAIYWISISPIYDQSVDEFFWGWHTREHFFNDDAVEMWDIESFDPGLTFPEGEPLYPGFDMAFELGTDQYKWEFDFGDAPEPDYRTRFEQNGPMHFYEPDVRLGVLVDRELNGQPSEEALGDDQNGTDDDDGVEFLTPLITGEDASVSVQASTVGYLDAWIDMFPDDDGGFSYPDQIIEGEELEPGENRIEFSLPKDARTGQTVARFRFSTVRNPVPVGLSIDGEVEDYVVQVQSSSAVDKQIERPMEFALSQNYPNPFNPSTTIRYAAPTTGRVRIEVFDLTGRKIKTLVDAAHAPGRFLAVWDGRDAAGQKVSSGVYLYRMDAGEFTQVRKLLLVK